jgi:hypothetical protein
VLFLAGDRARVAADAAIMVDNKPVAHVEYVKTRRRDREVSGLLRVRLTAHHKTFLRLVSASVAFNLSIAKERGWLILRAA